MAWTKESLEKAKELQEKGHSFSQIAKILKVSRNAVAGKFHRNNVTLATTRKPYLSELSWSSWGSPRYKEGA